MTSAPYKLYAFV